MLKHFVILAGLLLSTASLAQKAHVTMVIRSDHQYSLSLQKELYGMYYYDLIAEVAFVRDTTVTTAVQPDTSFLYRILDPGKLVYESFHLEAGDSLVFSFDMNKAESKLIFDRRGFFTERQEITRTLGVKNRSFDSLSKVVPWGPFQRVVDASMKQVRTELKPQLAMLSGSVHQRHAAELIDLVGLQSKLKYLSEAEWTPDLLARFPGEKLPLIEEMNGLQSSAYASNLTLQMIEVARSRAKARGRSYTESEVPVEVIDQFVGRARDLALGQRIHFALLDQSDSAGLARADSLLSVLNISDKTILAGVMQTIERRRSLLPGSNAPDFELPDTNGVIRRLSDHRGKVVLVDFWGTWCSPCVREIPHLKQLVADYANSDLVILGVAIEGRAVTKWRQFIRSKEMNWHHVYAEGQFWNEVVDRFAIGSVPRYFLVGRDGRVINANAPRPSRAELRELIDKALTATIN